MKSAMEGTNKTTAQLIGSTRGAIVETNALTAAQKTSTLAAKAQSAALKAVSIAGNMLLFTVIAKGIQLATTAIDNWIHRVEKANEAMNEAVSEYESAKSSLENVNSELDEQNKKLDELLAKDKLTYAEKGQLEELQKITKELLIQQDIEEKRANKASKEAADKTVDAYEKQYGKFDKTEDELKNKIDYYNFPIPQDKDDVLGNIAAYIRAKELFEQSQKDYDDALKNGEDTTWLADDVQHNIDMMDEYSQILDGNISDLQEKRVTLESEYNKAIEKRNSGIEPLTTSEKEIIETYESIYDAMRLVYEYTDPNTWKAMQIENVFNTEDIEKTKEELIEMAKKGTLDEGTIQSYFNLSNALAQNKVSASELCDEIYALAEAEKEAGAEASNTSSTFDITTYKEKLDDIKSSVTTLRSALDSLNSGDLDKIEVIDLMQQFPDLAPYIDLTADAFGNLSEGLSALIDQQPSSLIQSLQELKENLNTDRERVEVELLIDSLQRLGSYGDTGIEAYATTIGNTWSDTENVIEGVVNQFENLAKIQEMVADGLTMSATAAAELAKMYPEILTNAEVSANGQITLNEGVVSSILEGDSSIIEAQIAKLEADKAELTAKKSYAEAQLNMIKQVAEGEGKLHCPTPQ